jgi:hypothetical protein
MIPFPIPITFIPDEVVFIDIDHQTWQGHYTEALAMGFGEFKAREFANHQCQPEARKEAQ